MLPVSIRLVGTEKTHQMRRRGESCCERFSAWVVTASVASIWRGNRAGEQSLRYRKVIWTPGLKFSLLRFDFTSKQHSYHTESEISVWYECSSSPWRIGWPMPNAVKACGKRSRRNEQILNGNFIKQDEKHKTPVVYAGDVVRPGLLSPVK